FSSAQSYCKSKHGILAKINDIREIEDLLPYLLINNTYYFKRFSFDYSIINGKTYFWIDRTMNIRNDNTSSKGFLRKKCIEASKSIDRNCIVLRREKIFVNNVLYLQQFLSESDQCSSVSARPVSIDNNLESHLNTIPSILNNDLPIVKVNISLDYLCGNDTDYHLVGNYCYKILLHKTTWHEGKIECERDNATLFIQTGDMVYFPITELLLRRHNNISSTGIIHIGFSYVNEPSYIKQHKSIDKSIKTHAFDEEFYHNLCKTSHRDKIRNLLTSLYNLTMEDIDKFEVSATSCANIEIRQYFSIHTYCNEQSCNQPANVICQKLPIITTRAVFAKLLVACNYISL
ncbi:unnamed protein product, partial [Rotaria sp. Silwood2]